MTVARIVTLRGPIPATVGTFETLRKHEELKVMTVTRIATLRRQKRRQEDRDLSGPIGTFERFGLWRGATIPWGGWGGRIPRIRNIYPIFSQLKGDHNPKL